MWRFDEFELDPDLLELRRAGRPVAMQPRVFQLLTYLVTRRDRVVRKEELLAEVWRGESVVPEVVPTAIRTLRNVLGDSAVRPRFIRTVRGAGYRFAARAQSTRATVSSLAELNHRRFVNGPHDSEDLDVLRNLPFDTAMVWLSGREGSGKTRLLQELWYRAQLDDVPTAFLSGAVLDGTATDFQRSIDAAWRDSLGPARPMVLVDRADAANDLVRWLWEIWLPARTSAPVLIAAARDAMPFWLSRSPARSAVLSVQLTGIAPNSPMTRVSGF